MATSAEELAFPQLSNEEIECLRPFSTTLDLVDGDYIFRRGDPGVDLYVVESGRINVLNPADNNRVIAVHEPGGFSGDIDLFTRRPPIVTGVASGPTRVLRVPATCLRELLNRIPRFSEKMINAFTMRRKLLIEAGIAGLRVVGQGKCKDTALVREFLYKNFVPFTWYDPGTPEGRKVYEELGAPKHTPVIDFGDGHVLVMPPLPELARAAGVWQECPDQDVELAIVGGGPAGITAAVYAASEGLGTVVFERLGPGGQAAGSSRIENFIGFPTGLSGMELATRGVLQMLKFGARMVAPASVEKLAPATEPGEPHILHMDCGARIRAHTVLVATGVRWRRLDAINAERFEGAGVYYVCTSVEALLFDKHDLAVVGAGNSAGQAAMYLAECCPKRKVHMLIRHELGPGMSEYLVKRIRSTANIQVHEGVMVSEVIGSRSVEAVELTHRNSDRRERVSCSAMFVFIGAEPSAPWLPETVARDASGYILTGTEVIRSGRWPRADRDPCPLETTIPGVLAAGDIRSGSTKRVGFAVGDGSLAVTCAHRLRALRH